MKRLILVSLPGTELAINNITAVEPKCSGKATTFLCDECGETRASKRNLMSHMLIHIGGKLFTCSHCDYTCVLKSSLVTHKRTHIEKSFSCSNCSYLSSNKSNFNRHKLTHSNEKPFSC